MHISSSVLTSSGYRILQYTGTRPRRRRSCKGHYSCFTSNGTERSVLVTRLRIRILIDDRPELHILRDLLMHKYGREFAIAVMENRDGCVSERVSSILFFFLCVRSHAVVQITKKLAYLTPAPELVDAYLSEIARGYNVHWAPPERLSAKNDTDESTPDFG